VTVPQIGAMYAGDRARKETLIDFGFPFAIAVDNRPLQFEEFEERVGQTIYTSATPGVYEKENQGQTSCRADHPPNRPCDPEIIVRPVTGSLDHDTKGQVQDFLDEAEKVLENGGRVMVTTLTKKMAEDLAEFLKGPRIKAAYLHSDVETLDRITTLTDLRKGVYDVLGGCELASRRARPARGAARCDLGC
jgi:excinuclease ABC subunit B